MGSGSTAPERGAVLWEFKDFAQKHLLPNNFYIEYVLICYYCEYSRLNK